LKVIRGSASPVAGFDGPVNTALSLISRKSAPLVPVPTVNLVVDEASTSGPDRLTVELSSNRAKSLPVFTVLPVSVMRGLVVVLVKVELSTTRKYLNNISKELALSVNNGPAKVTLAGPVTSVLTLSSTRKKSPMSLPVDPIPFVPTLSVLLEN